MAESEGRRPRGGAITSFSTRVRALYAEGTFPTYVDRQLRTVDALPAEITVADHDLAATATADPIARRLMTVPGVGPTTAVRFVAALDEISRFRGAHAVESYLGLRPVLAAGRPAFLIRNAGHRRRGRPQNGRRVKRSHPSAGWIRWRRTASLTCP